MTYLFIPMQAWEDAEKYFLQNPDAIKFKRQSPDAHSFVRLKLEHGESRILALARGKDVIEGILGEGAFARVKIGQDKWGNQFAVKIEGGTFPQAKQTEITVLAALNLFEGFGRRFLGQYKIYKNAFVLDKFYTAMKKYAGQNLEGKIWILQAGKPMARRMLPMLERLNIAKKCCLELKKLQDKNIIHGDIKPSNFMITNTPQGDMLIYLIDFGFAQQLPPLEQLVWGVAGGTPAYMAPELIPPQHPTGVRGRSVPFSKGSDIFALGKMFERDLQLDVTLFSDMIAPHPKNRVDLKAVITRLDKAIQEEDQAQIKKQQRGVNRLRVEPVLYFTRYRPPETPSQYLRRKFGDLKLNSMG